jgi:hypothetical protein
MQLHMTRLLLFTVLFLFAFCGMGQSNDGLIRIRESIFGTRFYQNGERLSMARLTELLKPNEEAYRLFQSARTNKTLYYTLVIPGSFMMGYVSAEAATFFGNPNWGLFAAGTALTIAGTVFFYKAKNQTQTAIEHYNAGLHKTTLRVTEIKLGVCTNGLALKIGF